MAFGHLGPSESRRAECTILPDGRRRLTRYREVNLGAKITDGLWLPWGTVDDGATTEVTAGFTGLRLTGQKIVNDRSNDNQPTSYLVREYEQIAPTGETKVGDYAVTQLEDGRQAIVGEWIQFHETPAMPQIIGTSVDPMVGIAVLQREEKADDGTVRRIKRTYVSEGLIKQSDEIKNNGALTLRTLVHAVTQPATPAGYTLISVSTDSPAGYPIYTCTYAAGTGEIGRTVSTKNNGKLVVTQITHLTAATVNDDPTTNPGSAVVTDVDKREQDGYRIWTVSWAAGSGRVSYATETLFRHKLVRTTIRYLGVDDGDAISGDLVGQSDDEQDGYVLHTRTYVAIADDGIISSSVETKNNGKLVLYRIERIGSEPDTPAATIGGTVTLIASGVRHNAEFKIYSATFAEGTGEVGRSLDYIQSDDQGTTGITRTVISYLTDASVTDDPTSLAGNIKIGQERTHQDGYILWRVTYTRGAGLVGQYIHARQDGLREVTNLSVGARIAPSGIVIRDDNDKRDGVTVYTVSAIQFADGGDPTEGTLSFERFVPFTYPGRAVGFDNSNTMGGHTIDVFLSPPVTTDVLSTITVTYQTSNAIGTLPHYQWNPGTYGYATMRAEWVGLNQVPGNVVKALPGYRAVSNTVITHTAGVIGVNSGSVIFGNMIYGGTTAKLELSGGPPAPDGGPWVLDATIEPAFTAVDGTTYYRKTVVVATIPGQVGLSV